MSFTKSEVDLRIGGSYAEIYTHDNLTAQSIPTGATYTKCTAFTDNGESANCTADASNDKITITETGRYKVECSLSFTGTGTNKNWFASVFADGSEKSNIHFQRRIGVGGDYGSTQFGGMLEVTSVPVDIDLRFRHEDVGSLNLTVKYANLNIVRLGGV